MDLQTNDFVVRLFCPDDSTPSNAIKLVHRTDMKEVINDDTVSQRENLRRALRQMFSELNPHPSHIETSSLFLFDEVTVHLPESLCQGTIEKVSWDFVTRRWKYYVDCQNHATSAWYDQADLELNEPLPED